MVPLPVRRRDERSGRARRARRGSAIATRAGTWTGSTGGARRPAAAWRATAADAALAHGDGAVVLLHPWTTATGARPAGAHRRRPRAAAAIRAAGRLAVTTVLAVDGGNSKTDVALVAGDGRLLAAVRGPTSRTRRSAWSAGMERLAALVAEARAQAGAAHDGSRRRRASTASPAPTRRADVRLLTAQLAARGFAQDRPAPQRHLRGAAGGHGPGLGRRRDLRPGRQRRRRRARRPDGPARRARRDLGRLGRRRPTWAGRGWRRRSGRATAAGRGRRWSGRCRRTSGWHRRDALTLAMYDGRIAQRPHRGAVAGRVRGGDGR